MPKLDTTIDNLERKTNKVIGGIPSADWTDTQYPSAKTLYDIYNNLIHPVGSVFTTYTNTDPSAILGGTWELIDKEFKAVSLNVKSAGLWRAHNSSIGDSSVITLAGHTISVCLNLSTSMALSSSAVSLGQVLLSSCGISAFTAANTAVSGIASNPIIYEQTADGTIRFIKTLNGGSIASSTSFNICFDQLISKANMLDSFCDKFYWKRIA